MRLGQRRMDLAGTHASGVCGGDPMFEPSELPLAWKSESGRRSHLGSGQALCGQGLRFFVEGGGCAVGATAPVDLVSGPVTTGRYSRSRFIFAAIVRLISAYRTTETGLECRGGVVIRPLAG